MFTQSGRRGESHGPTTHPHHDQHGGYAARQPQESSQHRRHEDDWRRDRDRDRDRDEHSPPPRRYHFRGRERSGVLEWTAAVVFTVLAVTVLLAAVAVLVVVLLLQPRAPYLAVRAATLDALVYDQQGALDDVQVSAVVEARNGNARSAAAFSRLELRLAFAGTVLARLRADPFRVPPKGALPLAYVARAQGAPLGAAGSAAVEAALRDGVVPFGVDGEARTAWKVAGLVGVHHWTRLACELRFAWPNGTAINLSCSSKSKFWFF